MIITSSFSMGKMIDEDSLTENVSLDEWADHRYTDYALKSYEKDALRQIQEMLASGKYGSVKKCDGHMDYLENLSNKLKDILDNERRIGRENWDVERSHKKTKALYQALAKRREELKK